MKNRSAIPWATFEVNGGIRLRPKSKTTHMVTIRTYWLAVALEIAKSLRRAGHRIDTINRIVTYPEYQIKRRVWPEKKARKP